MSSHEVPPRNRAERRLAARTGRKARAAGAALTAGSAALAMSAAVLGTGVQSAGAATTLHVTTTADSGAGLAARPDRGRGAGRHDRLRRHRHDHAHERRDRVQQGPHHHRSRRGALTISGNDASRIFNVTGGPPVTISGLTLAHGSRQRRRRDRHRRCADPRPTTSSTTTPSTDDGGADPGRTARSTVTNSTFTNNYADDWGGAILATGESAAGDDQRLDLLGQRGRDATVVRSRSRTGAASRSAGTTFYGQQRRAGWRIELFDYATPQSCLDVDDHRQPRH